MCSLQVFHNLRSKYLINNKTFERSFGSLGIGMSASALASAFEYKVCLLHCINRL